MIESALVEALRERGHVNVVVAGRTGVGKSTLINAIFQGKMADVGQGRPVTKHTREITREGIPLSIWDTRGLEMADFKDSMAELDKLVAERSRDRDAKRHLHVAWICISEDGRRVEDAEVALHEMLARHMPVIAVITKARSDDGFRAEVQRLLPLARNVVRVRAIGEALDDGHTLSPVGLDTLVTLTAEVLPEGQQRAFAAAQKASVAHKSKVAQGIVASASASAMGVAAIPIPFADAALLVPIQIGMLAGISASFGLHPTSGLFATVIGSIVGTTTTTLVGRTFAGALLKLIPGGGAVAGGLVGAAMAGTFTAALGEVYIAALKKVFERSLGEPPSNAEVADEFQRQWAARSDTPKANGEGGS